MFLICRWIRYKRLYMYEIQHSNCFDRRRRDISAELVTILKVDNTSTAEKPTCCARRLSCDRSFANNRIYTMPVSSSPGLSLEYPSDADNSFWTSTKPWRILQKKHSVEPRDMPDTKVLGSRMIGSRMIGSITFIDLCDFQRLVCTILR